ncbi:DUF1045 domain-containing protein [Thalassovita sp.]|uniref:DUF1045 domain-containing protein n=1 Tax=Thalassovita sp. TaxID=1979401 RepID=UPI0029DE5A6E|nr:DUF1045 domain-containing protein [Thalassovita sp.]
MTEFNRYAIYFAPEPGPLADFAACWLGWDLLTGTPATQMELDGVNLDVITETPRKYGFHGTIKPPFRLAIGQDPSALTQATASLCKRLSPVVLDGLCLARLGRFLALVPSGDTTPLKMLAADVVRSLDRFRAAPDEQETARRLRARLTARQLELLHRWGYPYVMEEFRFHMTLTGTMPRPDAKALKAKLEPVLASLLHQPLRVNSLCLVGQDSSGMFRLIQRFFLSGQAPDTDNSTKIGQIVPDIHSK